MGVQEEDMGVEEEFVRFILSSSYYFSEIVQWRTESRERQQTVAKIVWFSKRGYFSLLMLV